jgi:hypothetical protein
MMFGTTLAFLFCLVIALVAIGALGFVTLLKAGIIVRHATKPTEPDRGSYSLSQGREVRPEEERQSERR